MLKIISISGKQFAMKSSVYTSFRYKNDTGRNLVADVKALSSKIGNEDEMMNELDEIFRKVLYIAYIMICEDNKEFKTSFEEWIGGLDDLVTDMNWLIDVLDLAMCPFRQRNNTATPIGER